MGNSTIERIEGGWSSMYSLLYNVKLNNGQGDSQRNFLTLYNEKIRADSITFCFNFWFWTNKEPSFDKCIGNWSNG